MKLRTKIVLGIIVVTTIGGISYRLIWGGNAAGNIQTDWVKKQNLRSTVLTTGQVVSSTDLALGFKASGVVKKISVREGDVVKEGETLAMLDQTDAYASLTSAQGSLAQAKANYDKVLAGASSEAIAVAEKAVEASQVALDNANTNLQSIKATQETAVVNAYATLLNTSFSAVAGSGNLDNVVPTITGTYIGLQEGIYQISLLNSGNGLRFQTQGLESSSGDVKTTPVFMGTKGLYITFASTPSIADTWTVNIPNTYASAYVSNNNAYQAALKARESAIASAQAQVSSAQAALLQAQASEASTRAQARPADIAVAKAQILSAEGQVKTAQALVENTTLKAPADGTITQVDIKVGEQTTALKEIIVLQDVGNLHVEANVSEASIASLKSGQDADLTFDALGPDRHFAGKVESINPASVVISGVVNYKITASFEPIPDIRPGMTANMTILAAKKEGVLAVPQRAVISKDGKKFVRVIDDAKRKAYHETEVGTGLEADGGLVEIIFGLSEGQEVVTYIKA
ncbi:MAG: efflux RND transporter periplasmic adaptor subunit [bacterium]|nr:efflux RND transporter periplasmic adaptor subunit [bacterium]